MFSDEFVGYKIHKINSCFCFVDDDNRMRKFNRSRRGFDMCKRAIINERLR